MAVNAELELQAVEEFLLDSETVLAVVQCPCVHAFIITCTRVCVHTHNLQYIVSSWISFFRTWRILPKCSRQMGPNRWCSITKKVLYLVLKVKTSSRVRFYHPLRPGLATHLNFSVSHAFYAIFTETGRVFPGHPKGSKVQRLFSTDGTKEPLTGKCLYFIRPNNTVEVTAKNIVEVGISSAHMTLFISILFYSFFTFVLSTK